MKVLIPHLEYPPFLSLVTPETEFHCVFGIHEAWVTDDAGNHCDACGIRIWYEEVEDGPLPQDSPSL